MVLLKALPQPPGKYRNRVSFLETLEQFDRILLCPLTLITDETEASKTQDNFSL